MFLHYATQHLDNRTLASMRVKALEAMGEVRRLNTTSAMFTNRISPPEEALPPAITPAALDVVLLHVQADNPASH